jgi:hypothetical protein
MCVQGSFTALWNSTITEPGRTTVSCPNCCYESWSLWQTKVYYQWMTWPEIMQSTAFAADYRHADQRACMDDAYTSYFASSTKPAEHLRVRHRQLPELSRHREHGPGVVGLHRNALFGELV